MKRRAKQAAAYAEGHGYAMDHRNSKGFMVFTNGAGHEVLVSPSLDDEATLRRLCRDIDRACGVGPDLSQKRHPEQIKARRERCREIERQERARRQAELDQLAREKQTALLGGHGVHLTQHEVKRIERRIEQIEAEIRAVVRQMTTRESA